MLSSTYAEHYKSLIEKAPKDQLQRVAYSNTKSGAVLKELITPEDLMILRMYAQFIYLQEYEL